MKHKTLFLIIPLFLFLSACMAPKKKFIVKVERSVQLCPPEKPADITCPSEECPVPSTFTQMEPAFNLCSIRHQECVLSVQQWEQRYDACQKIYRETNQ